MAGWVKEIPNGQARGRGEGRLRGPHILDVNLDSLRVKRVLCPRKNIRCLWCFRAQEELDELFALSSLFLNLPLVPKTAIIGLHLFIEQPYLSALFAQPSFPLWVLSKETLRLSAGRCYSGFLPSPPSSDTHLNPG
jgi:hypothetical protein